MQMGRTLEHAQGELAVHCGQMMHGGVKVTSGRRYILTGFISVGGPNLNESFFRGKTLSDHAADNRGYRAMYAERQDEQYLTEPSCPGARGWTSRRGSLGSGSGPRRRRRDGAGVCLRRRGRSAPERRGGGGRPRRAGTGGGPDRRRPPSGRLWLWLGLSETEGSRGETESSCTFFNQRSVRGASVRLSRAVRRPYVSSPTRGTR